jgi:hypothetical protein
MNTAEGMLRFSVGLLALFFELAAYWALWMEHSGIGDKETPMAIYIIVAPISLALIAAHFLWTLVRARKGFRNWVLVLLWLGLAIPFMVK